MLINRHTKKGDRVLDLGGGAGGDILKYKKSKVSHLVLVDISSSQIEQAKARVQASDKPGTTYIRFRALQADFTKMDISRAVTDTFDVVSCQMAFHYCWKTEQTARRMLHNVSYRLKVGGQFIGTLPDAKKVQPLVFPTWSNAFAKLRPSIPTYGAEYYFSLTEAIVDCPEYLVPFGTPTELAAEYGLRLHMHINFQEFWNREVTTSLGRELLATLRVPLMSEISNEEREVFGLYCVFVFKKDKPYPEVK